MHELLEKLAELRVIPVLTAASAAEAERACAALLEGGLPCVEITFRTEAAVEAIRRVSRIDGLLVGAGTILTRDQLALALEAGASFAVAPDASADVLEEAVSVGATLVPGAATPSEIHRSRALGFRVVKVFPAALLGGPAFIKAVAPVYPDVRFVPTGGITADDLPSYLELPAVLACAGTWICEQTLLRDGRFDEIERRARKAVELASTAVAA